MTGAELVDIINDPDNRLWAEEILPDSIIRFTAKHSKSPETFAYQTVHCDTEYFDTDVVAIRPGDITYCLKDEYLETSDV